MLSLLTTILSIAPALVGSASAQVTIMPMGDSLTAGVDYFTQSSGGYRDPLYRHLTGAGFAFTFVGANNSISTPLLTNSGQSSHDGFGSWHIQDLNNNLEGVAAPIAGGDSNQGGYLLTGGHGTGRSAVFPTIILLHIGTNDLLQGTPTINQDLNTLVTHIHALSPATVILVAGVTPMNSSGFASAIASYNSYIKNQLVPSLFYTRYVDQNTAFLNADGSINGALLGTDLVHPNRFGYPIMAQNWAAAIEALEGVNTAGFGKLTVTSGTGSGSYPPGSIVTLGANPAASGSQFASWSPANTALLNPFGSPTTYLMPAGSATLTAHYSASGSPLIPNGTYNIVSSYDNQAVAAAASINNSAVQQQPIGATSLQSWDLVNLGNNAVTLMLSGTREGIEVPAGTVGTLAAPLDLMNYTSGSNQQWTLAPAQGAVQITNQASSELLNIQGYSTAPDATILQYTSGFPTELWNFFPAAGSASTYPLTVANGAGGGSYPAGSSVTVTANPAASGFTFAGWTGVTAGLANASASTTTFMTSANAATITATYRATPVSYTLTVNSGTGTGTYAAGAQVTISADAPPSGSSFTGWTGATGSLASATSATTTLTMPSTATSVTATYTVNPIATSSTGGNLGIFSLFAESASQGNVMSIAYGVSTEGDVLITYWQPTSPGMTVLAMGGNQYELIENLGGRCITVNGFGVTINTCTGRANQLFALNPQPDGSYTIQSGSSSCVDSPGSFTRVDAIACDASSSGQRWVFSGPRPLTLTVSNGPAAPAGYPLTVNSGTGAGTYTAGAQVAVSANPAPSGSTFSGWTGATGSLASVSSATTTLTMPAAAISIAASYTANPVATSSAGGSLGIFSLLAESASQGNVMSIAYGQSTEGDLLITYWQPATPGMTVLSMGSSLYEIVENQGGRCMTTNGAAVTINTCTGSANQLFALNPQSDGSYTIQSGSSSCIESPGSFTRLDATACNASSSAQRWMFSGPQPLTLNTASAPPPAPPQLPPTVPAPPPVASQPSSSVPAGYHLTFDDEFNTLSISDVNGGASNWYTHTVQCCLYDTSAPATPTYMAGISDPVGQSPYTLTSSGLDLRLQKTRGAWYSGVLASVDGNGHGFSQQYGYFEMKAKFPAGAGTWPAFWLLNTAARTSNAPAGEIDVVESYMAFPNAINTTLHDWTPPATTVGYKLSNVADLTQGFHTFGMLWTPSTMTFYCDGVQLYTLPTPAIMHQPFYPVLDLGLGGGWPTNQTPAQSDMIVQYVRVYSS